MQEDRSLFGSGRYPDDAPLAFLARLAFVGAIAAVLVAVFLPPSLVPKFARSHYLEHFAAFYVLLLAALAAFPRDQLRRVVTGFAVFATALELSHLPAHASFNPLVHNWVADLGGLSAAAAPVIVERFRRRFPKPPPPPPPEG